MWRRRAAGWAGQAVRLQFADLVAAAGALVILGPALLPGYVLLRDMMFVPDPAWSPRLLGLSSEVARAVPSDLAVYLASLVLPGAVVQKLALVGALVLAGSGAARCVPGAGRLATSTAALTAVWNPWVGERLLMGHWALLLGYAAVPWVARLAWRRFAEGGHWPGLAGAIAVSGIGGASAQVLSTLALAGAAVAVGLTGGARVSMSGWARRAWAPLLLQLAWAVPWLAPSLVGAVGVVGAGDPSGFAAFAAAPDTPLGLPLSVLTGGGIWNADAVPPGRDSLAALGAVLILAIALWGLAIQGRRDEVARAVAATGLLGLVVVGLTGWEPGRAILQSMPGGGLLRDATRQSGPWMIVLAVGLGCAVQAVRGRSTWGELAWVGTVLPVAVLPLLAGGVGGALRPVDYPADLLAVAQRLDHDAGEPVGAGAVLILPWYTTRAYPWNADQPSLSPWSRLLSGSVVESSDLVIDVGLDQIVVAGENPPGRAVVEALAGPTPAAALADVGIDWVVVDDPKDDTCVGTLVQGGPNVRLYRLAREVTVPPGGEPDVRLAVVSADVGAAFLVVALSLLSWRGRGPRRELNYPVT